MSHLNFGILGAADIAKRYMADALQKTPGTQLEGVSSRDPKRAEELAAKFKVKAYASYEELLKDPSIHAVYIPLPIGLHEKWTLAALEAGKHVLCEKSLSGSYQESKRMLELADKKGLVLDENFMCEHHPQNLFVQDLVAKGELGKIRAASLSFGFPPMNADNIRYSQALDSGALNDAGAYCLNMATYYLQKYPAAVWANLESGGHKVDNCGTVTLLFEDSTTAHLGFGFDHDYRNETRIWGQKGSLVIDRCFSIPPDRKPNVKLIRNNETHEYDLPACNHFIRQLERFCEIVASKNATALHRKLARQAMLMEAVRISNREKRVFKMADFDDWKE